MGWLIERKFSSTSATRDFATYLEGPKCAEWDQLMQTFQEVVPEAKPGELWALMEPVYELK